MSATRTSPRLAGYYAARAAAAEQRASAVALVDRVLAYKPAVAASAGERRSPRLAAASAPVQRRTSPRLADDGAVFSRLAGLTLGVLRGVFATGAYWARDPMPEEDAYAWISERQNMLLIAGTIRSWILADPLKARRMGETEVENALLKSPVWVAALAAMEG
jgi:hypothetical protein